MWEYGDFVDILNPMKMWEKLTLNMVRMNILFLDHLYNTSKYLEGNVNTCTKHVESVHLVFLQKQGPNLVQGNWNK